MNHKNLPLSSIFILLILSSACGPLVPLSYQKENIDIYQTIKTDEATITLEFIQSQYGHYIFDLEVVNHSTTPINISPQTISFYASPKTFASITSEGVDVHQLSFSNSALLMKRQFAYSPNEIKRLYQEKVKSKKAANVFFAVLGAGLVIFDAVKDSKDNHKETWTKNDEAKAISRDALVAVALTTSDLAKLSSYQAEDDNYYVPLELFPECTIQPGMNKRGKIFIPIEKSYRYARVVIPVQDSDYVFDLKRRGVRSTQSQSPHHP